MRSALSIVLVGLSGLALVACGSSGPDGPRGGGGTGGVVTLDCATLTHPPPDCQKACTSDSQCEASFCSNGVCLAQCTPDEGCPTGSTCNVTGRCVPDVGTGGTGGGGNTGGSGCQSIQVTPTRSIPNVMFLVDQSGTMNYNDFGPNNQKRWAAAHGAITSIVGSLDEIVSFGLTTYTWNENQNQNPACPELPIRIGFGPSGPDANTDLSNFPSGFPGGEDTPTGDSIDALVGVIQNGPAPPGDGPTIIVLATDGEPDSCEYPDPSSGSNEEAFSRNEAVTAAANAHLSGIDVFVLWVGELTIPETRDHLQDVANAGVSGDGTVWVGDKPASLATAFQSIISDSISCDVQIDKPFDNVEKACNEGDVRLNGLNGTPLSCDYDEPGMGDWQVQGNDVIRLLGSACETFKSGSSTLSAVFPCGAIVVE